MTVTRLDFLNLPVAERSLYFEQAALRRGLHPAIMEKDFWVCWILGILFGDTSFRHELVFKGGTSLSKAFGVLDRFSEDIDLALSPKAVGIDEETLRGIATRTQNDR